MTEFFKGQQVTTTDTLAIGTIVTGNKNKDGNILVEFSDNRRWCDPHYMQGKSDSAEKIGDVAARVVLDIETRAGVDFASGPDKAVMVAMKDGEIIGTTELPSGLYEYQKAAYEQISQQPSRMHRLPRRIGKIPELAWPYGSGQISNRKKAIVRGWQAHLDVTGRVDNPKAVLTAQDRRERRMRANRRPL